MKWQDILKEVITQGKIKEIEDIDIDIEDDDCLRWFNRLTQILTRHPETEEHEVMKKYKRIENEEDACSVKEAWESPLYYDYTKGRIFVMNLDGNERRVWVGAGVTNREKTNHDYGFLSPNNTDPYVITLSAVITKALKAGDFLRLELAFISKDLSKTKRVIKELCDYLNLNYNVMLEGLE